MHHVFSYDKPFLRKILNLNVKAAGVLELILENRRFPDSDLTAALQMPIEIHEVIYSVIEFLNCAKMAQMHQGV
jgi:hypothetical protein